MKVEEELGGVCIWMRKTEAGLDGLGKGQTQELKFVLELESVEQIQKRKARQRYIAGSSRAVWAGGFSPCTSQYFPSEMARHSLDLV